MERILLRRSASLGSDGKRGEERKCGGVLSIGRAPGQNVCLLMAYIKEVTSFLKGCYCTLCERVKSTACSIFDAKHTSQLYI